MYACYIDESGHCGEKYDPNQPVEVLCGVLTDVTKLFKTKREHSKFMELLEENSISTTELKAGDIHRGRKGWSGIDPKKRRDFIESLLQWAHDRSCKYIISPIDSEKFFNGKDAGCPISHRLLYPYEAGCMNIILAIQRQQKTKKNNKGKTWIILDEQNSHDKRITKLLDTDLEFTDGYTGFSTKGKVPRLGEVIDIPFFSKSHKSVVIQIADLVAYIVNRYLLLTVYRKLESYTDELKVIWKWYSIIKDDLVVHSHINPPGTDALSIFYRDVRPEGWTAKDWFV